MCTGEIKVRDPSVERSRPEKVKTTEDVCEADPLSILKSSRISDPSLESSSAASELFGGEDTRTSAATAADEGSRFVVPGSLSRTSFYDDTPSVSFRGVHTFNCAYLGIVHVLALVGVCLLPWASWKTIAFVLVGQQLSTMGVTAGAHRLWSHHAYEAHWSVKAFLIVLCSFANQGSIFHWCRDHRLHHKYVDTPRDPHSAGYGFWYSHMNWLFLKKSKYTVEAGHSIYMDDLKKDPFIQWQRRNNIWMSILCCFVLPSMLCYYGWGDLWTGIFVGGFLRYVFSLHMTWLVNSGAHMWDTLHKALGLDPRPYNKDIQPVENWFVSMLTVGEGWHNYHHAYPYDYSANEHGWVQWNPTTLFIDFCARLGLVWSRRRANIKSVSDPAELPCYTQEDIRMEVCAHNAMLVIVDGLVYDVTEFVDVHPGGPAYLRAYIGKDATKVFHGGIHEHSSAASTTLEQFVIGRLVEGHGDGRALSSKKSS